MDQGNIPIEVKSQKKPRNKLRIFLWSAIISLMVFNLGLGYLYFTGKKYVSDFADSAQNATKNSNRWGVLADIGLPSQDVAGEEIPGLVRFPESVRTYYLDSNDMIIAEYQAAENQEIVGNYFKAYLANNNWVLNEISPENLSFSKDGHEVQITFSQKIQITTYHIEYR